MDNSTRVMMLQQSHQNWHNNTSVPWEDS